MARKTLNELENEMLIDKVMDRERKVSNEAYAIKLVERIVFGLVTMILVSVGAAIVGLVVIK